MGDPKNMDGKGTAVKAGGIMLSDDLARAGADHTECPGGDVELDFWKSVPARMVDEVHADLDCVS